MIHIERDENRRAMNDKYNISTGCNKKRKNI